MYYFAFDFKSACNSLTLLPLLSWNPASSFRISILIVKNNTLCLLLSCGVFEIEDCGGENSWQNFDIVSQRSADFKGEDEFVVLLQWSFYNNFGFHTSLIGVPPVKTLRTPMYISIHSIEWKGLKFFVVYFIFIFEFSSELCLFSISETLFPVCHKNQ